MAVTHHTRHVLSGNRIFVQRVQNGSELVHQVHEVLSLALARVVAVATVAQVPGVLPDHLPNRRHRSLVLVQDLKNLKRRIQALALVVLLFDMSYPLLD